MSHVLEEVARVGLAGWIGTSVAGFDSLPLLGTIGDDLYLVEIDESNRDRVLLGIIDDYKVANHELADRSPRIEVVFFGKAGGFLASSMEFLDLWPKSHAEMPTDVFVDNHRRAAFTHADGEVVVSVRHALRPSGAPQRRFRFHPNQYQQAMSQLARESRRLRDDLIAIARQRAPEKAKALQKAFER
jgi:hypothetical protein